MPGKVLRVLLLSGSEDIGLKVLYCLSKTGHTIYVMANDSRSILRCSKLAKEFVHIPWHPDNRGPDEADAIRRYLETKKIDVVIPGDISASIYLAENESVFSSCHCLPVSTRKKYADMDDKWVFAQRLMTSGISTPRTILLADKNDVTEAHLASLRFPIIIKPLRGESSHGVVEIASFCALEGYLATPGKYRAFPVIAQQFIDGEDIDLSFLSANGHIVAEATQRWLTLDELVFCENKQVHQLAHEIVALYDFDGPGHFDMRIEHSTGKIYVIECNPRFWASMPAAMWCGTNFAEMAILLACGRSIPLACVSGNYQLPMSLLKRVLRRPALWFELSPEQRHGMLQPLCDIGPHIAKAFRRKQHF